MTEVQGHALHPASAIMEPSHARLEGPMTVIALHSASALEDNDPIEIVGKFLTSALELLKCHLPDILAPRECMPSGVLQPVSLSR